MQKTVIGEELWKKFNNTNPMEQEIYYGHLAKAFEEDEFIRSTPAFKEYIELCSHLFSTEYDT